MTHAEYHANEIKRYQTDRSYRENATLAERKEAKADFAGLLADPESLAVRVEFLLNGSFGYAQQFYAKEIVGNLRMNRVAGIAQLVALWECSCPQREAIAAWKSLKPETRTAADAAIAGAIAEWEENRKAEAELQTATL